MPEKKPIAEWWREELETASKELDSGRVEEARTRLDLAYHLEDAAKKIVERAPLRTERALEEIIALIDGDRIVRAHADPLEQARYEIEDLRGELGRVRQIAETALARSEPF